MPTKTLGSLKTGYDGLLKKFGSKKALSKHYSEMGKKRWRKYHAAKKLEGKK